MATPTELRDSLQKISALMGLLRSDLLELAETRVKRRRGPVVDHIHWIADQLDELGDGLSDVKARPAVAKRKAAAPKRTAAKSSARTSGARSLSGHPATSHASSRRPPSHGAHHDSARPAPRRSPRGATKKTPQAVEASKPSPDGSNDNGMRQNKQDTSAPRPETLTRPEAPTATPKLPDVPAMPGEDKLH